MGFFKKIYLFMIDIEREREREREREAETQEEGEAGSMQGARQGTRSWVSIPGLQDHALGRRQALNR